MHLQGLFARRSRLHMDVIGLALVLKASGVRIVVQAGRTSRQFQFRHMRLGRAEEARD